MKRLAIALSLGSLLSAGAAQAGLVGQWTFEGPNPLADSTGNFPDLMLMGDASISGGQLDVNGTGTTPSGWAVTQGGYAGPTISEKTLISWLTLQSFNANAGSGLTIDRQTSDLFDAIVFGETQPSRWSAGSSNFDRTQALAPGFEETTTGSLIKMAITYKSLAGTAEVKVYRNGSLIGNYTQGSLASWPTGDAEVLFGVRHVPTGGPRGALDALIEEARIYDTVLTEQEIADLTPSTVPGPLPLLGALAAFRASRRLRARRSEACQTL